MPGVAIVSVVITPVVVAVAVMVVPVMTQVVVSPAQTENRADPPKRLIIKKVIRFVRVVVGGIRGWIIVIYTGCLWVNYIVGFVIRDIYDFFVHRFDHDGLVFYIDGLFVVCVDIAGGECLVAHVLDGAHEGLFLVNDGLAQLPCPVDIII